MCSKQLWTPDNARTKQSSRVSALPEQRTAPPSALLTLDDPEANVKVPSSVQPSRKSAGCGCKLACRLHAVVARGEVHTGRRMMRDERSETSRSRKRRELKCERSPSGIVLMILESGAWPLALEAWLSKASEATQHGTVQASIELLELFLDCEGMDGHEHFHDPADGQKERRLVHGGC